MKYILSVLNQRTSMEVASRVLPKDWEECEAWTGNSPATALIRACRERSPSMAVHTTTGEPLAALGATAVASNQVRVWLMGTDAITLTDAKFFVKNMENGLALLCEMVGQPDAHAVCMASTENTVHMRWLSRNGWVLTGKTETRNNVMFKELLYVRS